jgi:NAD-dependent deacetylase
MTEPRARIAVLSGAGLSVASGLPTYRGGEGLWRGHDWRELASPEGWARHPEAVLAFYDERRRASWDASPSAAHRAIAALEAAFDVVVLTQNVDGLHEKAGSTRVVHLHGELAWARSVADPRLRVHLGGEPLAPGRRGEDGQPLRPDVVWFGEAVRHLDEARFALGTASKVLVVGTSLTVQPAASLAVLAPPQAERVLVALEPGAITPRGYDVLLGEAETHVPALAARWLAEAGAAG